MIEKCSSSTVHPDSVMGELGNKLANMPTMAQVIEFGRLGALMKTDPGPMPSGASVCKAGLFITAALGLNRIQQWFIKTFVWEGKVFRENDAKPISDQNNRDGHFWLTNNLKLLALWATIKDGTTAWVYRNDASWCKDGNPTIFIDYSPSWIFKYWIHDEIRFAGYNPNGTACYLGIMWCFIGPIRVPFAYFIVDQVTPVL